MARTGRTVSLLGAALAMFWMGCTSASEGPKTVVDSNAAQSGTPGSDAPAAEAPKTEVTDIEPVRVPIEGSDLVEARATISVNAPIDKARATILKFEDYPQFMPEYSDARRLGKLPSGNEKVYMEITTLGGIAKMYANVEILPVAQDGTSEKHEAKFIDGNVKQFKALWTIKKVDDKRSEITLQVFLHPSLPLPDSLVNAANLDGAKKGVIAMKKRIEAAP